MPSSPSSPAHAPHMTLRRLVALVVASATLFGMASLPAAPAGAQRAPGVGTSPTTAAAPATTTATATTPTTAATRPTTAPTTSTTAARRSTTAPPTTKAPATATALAPVTAAAVPAGTTVLVANFGVFGKGAGSVTGYPDPPTGCTGTRPTCDTAPSETIAGPSTGLHAVAGVAKDAAGNTYVATFGGGTDPTAIRQFAPDASGDTPPVATLAGPKTGLCFPSGPFLDPSGTHLYTYNCADSGTVLTEYNLPLTGGANCVGTPPVCDTPPFATMTVSDNIGNGLAIDSGGNLYIPISDTVVKYAPLVAGTQTGTVLATLGGPATRLSRPQNVIIRNNTLYTDNAGTPSITAYPLPFSHCAGDPPVCNEPPSVTLVGPNTGLNHPLGMAFDPAGNLFVVNDAGNASPPASVTEYSANQVAVSGDPTPVATIIGPSTQLSDPQLVAIQVAPGTPLSVATTSPLPPATLNSPYSALLGASGGKAPYTWTLASGSLPAGLTLAPDGTISGTPSATGTTIFTVKVTDSSAQTATAQLSLTVKPAAPALSIATPSPLPPATKGAPYSQALAATGGTPPFYWSLAPGSALPPGLTLGADGTISGTPTAAGAFSFTVQVDDFSSPTQSATKNFSLTVGAAPLAITTPSPLPDAHVTNDYFASLGATGGTSPYTWSVAAGSLPPGLSLSPDGIITGKPTVQGTTTFTLRVTDSSTPAQSVTKEFTLTVGPPLLTITTPATLPGGTKGAPYSTTVAVTGGTPPYTFSLVPGFGVLPPGLTLSPSTGVISGTPTLAGTFGFIVHVDDSGNPVQSDERSFTLNVKEGPPFAPGSAVAWGLNSSSQLGTGLTSADVSGGLDLPNPVVLPPGVTAVQVAAGSNASYALSSDGHVYAWGGNGSGQLGVGTRGGQGDPGGDSAVPVEVCAAGGCANGFLSNIVAISAGDQFALALTSGGQVLAWGLDNQGQAGNGTGNPFGYTTPVAVSLPPGTTVRAISAGRGNGLAVTTAGNVLSWGQNDHGQIGDGSTGQFFGVQTPVFVCAVGGCANGTLSGITSVSAGLGTFSLAITAGGGVVAWGNNTDGELGNGTSGTDVLTPTPTSIPAGTKVAAVSGGDLGSLALTTTGRVLSWGYLNGHGSQPGLGNGSTTGSATPVTLALPPATAVSTGSFIGTNLVLTAAGTVLAWGDNSVGELGQGMGYGNPPSSLTPVTVVMPAGTVISAISAGGQHNLAVVLPRVRCDRTVTGSQGSVVVAAGSSVCLDRANISGSLTVQRGAALSIRNSSVSRGITADGATGFELCYSRVGGALNVTNSTGFVLIGDPGDDNCPANSVQMPTVLDHNTAGVEVVGNSLSGLTFTNNSGVGPRPDDTAPEIERNRVIGNLACSGNVPAPTNDGQPNNVTGARSGQCAAPGF